MAGHRRGPWSNQEDNYLMQLVNHHGPFNWVQIAQTLGSRTPKQCRERYHQNLKPSLNHNPITPEEGVEIERLVQEVGKRWAEIARRLDNRSDNAVKNWWNGNQNRRKRRSRDCQDMSCNGHWHPDAPQPSNPTSPSPLPSGSSSMTNHSVLSLPPPSSQQTYPFSHSYTHGHACSHNYDRRGLFIEPALPSPSSSESAESELTSNYTTSPTHHSLSLPKPVDLPPVRSWGVQQPENHQLPSFSSLAPPSPQAPRRIPQLPLPQTTSHTVTASATSHPWRTYDAPTGDLPTAPSSPKDYQYHKDFKPGEESAGPRDPRLSVASLLTSQSRRTY